MTLYISPVIGALFVISVLIGSWVYRTASPTPPTTAGQRTSDLVAAITAASAVFAVLCIVFTAPQGTAQHQPPAHQAPAPTTDP
ncbi:hypothetical protein [Streptomyces sp. NBC_01789]|uniref:hypothetical protein n=1 Tax=Streptomyces sp. NBC_01789 TaxID=2975941 RepID=UPI00224C9BA0|nr:hypothetical protein [Streptomyces sp. NBC_01789]MCX4451582.1 hypothetical protein [Streptomyces sp. NBC_01789]